jgi:hypothetical protein
MQRAVTDSPSVRLRDTVPRTTVATGTGRPSGLRHRDDAVPGVPGTRRSPSRCRRRPPSRSSRSRPRRGIVRRPGDSAVRFHRFPSASLNTTLIGTESPTFRARKPGRHQCDGDGAFNLRFGHQGPNFHTRSRRAPPDRENQRYLGALSFGDYRRGWRRCGGLERGLETWAGSFLSREILHRRRSAAGGAGCGAGLGGAGGGGAGTATTAVHLHVHRRSLAFDRRHDDAMPAATAVTRPLFTATTEGLLELHATGRPGSSWPLASLLTAVSCTLAPARGPAPEVSRTLRRPSRCHRHAGRRGFAFAGGRRSQPCVAGSGSRFRRPQRWPPPVPGTPGDRLIHRFAVVSLTVAFKLALLTYLQAEIGRQRSPLPSGPR